MVLLSHLQDFIYDKGLKDRLLLFLEDHLHKVAVHDQEQMEIIEDIIQLAFLSIISKYLCVFVNTVNSRN